MHIASVTTIQRAEIGFLTNLFHRVIHEHGEKMAMVLIRRTSDSSAGGILPQIQAFLSAEQCKQCLGAWQYGFKTLSESEPGLNSRLVLHYRFLIGLKYEFELECSS